VPRQDTSRPTTAAPPPLADAERAISYAQENLSLAAQAGGEAERSSGYKQAAQALSSAGRIMDGLAAAIAPPEPHRWGVDLGLPGRSRPALFGPGPV
jgi:hypothetical protein